VWYASSTPLSDKSGM
jgi:hypothetical protein